MNQPKINLNPDSEEEKELFQEMISAYRLSVQSLEETILLHLLEDGLCLLKIGAFNEDGNAEIEVHKVHHIDPSDPGSINIPLNTCLWKGE